MTQNVINKIVSASSGTVYGETPAMHIAGGYGLLFPISLYGTNFSSPWMEFMPAGNPLGQGYNHKFKFRVCLHWERYALMS